MTTKKSGTAHAAVEVTKETLAAKSARERESAERGGSVAPIPHTAPRTAEHTGPTIRSQFHPKAEVVQPQTPIALAIPDPASPPKQVSDPTRPLMVDRGEDEDLDREEDRSFIHLPKGVDKIRYADDGSIRTTAPQNQPYISKV